MAIGGGLLVDGTAQVQTDEKKGVDSKEKEEIRKIVGNLVPDGMQYTAAYISF